MEECKWWCIAKNIQTNTYPKQAHKGTIKPIETNLNRLNLSNTPKLYENKVASDIDETIQHDFNVSLPVCPVVGIINPFSTYSPLLYPLKTEKLVF